jgi:hypothetical protein
MSADPAGEYQVIFLQHARQQVRELGEGLGSPELRERLAQVLRAAIEHLARAPVAWGDPWYRLRHLGMLVCNRGYGSLHFIYAVNEQQRLVFVTRVETITGSPFKGPA